MQALLSLFRLISAHFSSCITGKNLFYIEPHSEDAYLYAGGLPFFLSGLWASIQFEFTYITWTNKQMGFANVNGESTMMSNNNR